MLMVLVAFQNSRLILGKRLVNLFQIKKLNNTPPIKNNDIIIKTTQAYLFLLSLLNKHLSESMIKFIAPAITKITNISPGIYFIELWIYKVNLQRTC